MMWRSSGCVTLELILGFLVWVAPVSAWAGSPEKVPDEARLREAAELQRDYMSLFEQGKYDEASTLAEQVCSILEGEFGKTSNQFATCLNNLGVLRREQGAHGAARLLFERALAISEKALGPNHPQIAHKLESLASLYVAQGEYGKAEPLLERALTLFEKGLGPDHPDVAVGLNSLAELYWNQGRYKEAVPLLERALAIREKAFGSDHPDVAISLNNLAELYVSQGAYEEAEPLLERALAISEEALGHNHPQVANSLNSLADLYWHQGRYEKEELFLERALAISERALGAHHPHVAIILNNQAELYVAQGRDGEGELFLERALAINEKTLGSGHPDVAKNVNNLAELYRNQGAYEKAESLYERALAINEKAKGPDHPDVAGSLHNLALLYSVQGAHGKAELLYRRALAIFERALGPDHPHVATSLSSLAAVLHEQGAYRTAESLLKRALAIEEKTLGPDHPHVAKNLNNLAMLHSQQGRHGRAETLHKRALAIKEKALGSDHPDLVTTLNNLAVLYDDQGQYNTALELHQRAFDIEETSITRTLVVADESRRLRYVWTLSGSFHYILSLHLRVAPEGNSSIANLALTTLLRRKNRVQELVTQTTAALRRSLPEDDRYLLDDLSEADSRIAVLSNRGPDKLGVEAFSQRLYKLRQERDRLWRELAKHSALIESLDHPITIDGVQRALPNDGALIELIQYIPYHGDAGAQWREHPAKPLPRYAAYLVFPDRFDWVDLGPAAPIDEHVKAFRKALQTKQAIPTDLYDAVMRPIVEKLGSTHRLVIAPAGALSLIPFGALHDGERYLVEKYEMRYVTTGRDLLDPPTSPAVTTTPVTVVANPTGAFLPDAEAEADFLEGFFPDTRVLRGEQATDTNVRTVERPLILHMATHGFFGEALNERDNPLFRSGLYLADVDQVEVDRERDDGQLTAYEVSGMDLRGTQLVVLSACETGMGAEVISEGKVLMSEGVSGLRRAFAMAGARTTVMSLWPVSGVTAQTTMEAYYRKLAEGQGPGEAMQAVQLEMLQTKEHAHPKDWAVFIVSGDDDPMDFPAGQGPREVEDEPPQTESRGGCATKPSDRGAPTGSLLIGLLGLTALRRRGR